jgi:hypothetical protein
MGQLDAIRLDNIFKIEMNFFDKKASKHPITRV